MFSYNASLSITFPRTVFFMTILKPFFRYRNSNFFGSIRLHSLLLSISLQIFLVAFILLSTFFYVLFVFHLMRDIRDFCDIPRNILIYIRITPLAAIAPNPTCSSVHCQLEKKAKKCIGGNPSGCQWKKKK